MTKQGRADKSNNVFVGVGLRSDAFGSMAPYGDRPMDGRKREPNPKVYNPGGVGQLGNAVGNHVTSTTNTDYRGDPIVGGRGYKAPPVKSQSSNRGSQGKY